MNKFNINVFSLYCSQKIPSGEVQQALCSEPMRLSNISLLTTIMNRGRKVLFCSVSIGGGKIFKAVKNILVAGSVSLRLYGRLFKPESPNQNNTTHLSVMLQFKVFSHLDSCILSNLVLLLNTIMTVANLSSVMKLFLFWNFIKDTLAYKH